MVKGFDGANSGGNLMTGVVQRLRQIDDPNRVAGYRGGQVLTP
jgi:hypothetical protein